MTKQNKKGPLSKAEKTQIHEMLGHGDDVATISDATNRSEKVISKYIGSMPQEQSNTNIKAETHRGEAGKMFARNEKYGATIMTQNASVASDESRAKRQESANSVSRFSGRIHVIKKDK